MNRSTLNQEDTGKVTDLKPPCVVSCPVLTDTRLLAQMISEGRYEEALEVLLAANPFSSVCGRICPHPCETGCRRNQVDAPVSLRMLKRFVIENTREYRKKRTRKPKKSTGKKVAIIGSGPAGLTAAQDLALEGHSVTVFERSNEIGGMLIDALPRYRLPAEAVKEDIDDILRLGVEVKTGVEVGTDVKIMDLKKEYDAVLLAVGLSLSRSVPVPGVNADGVLLAIPFLISITRGKPLPVGDKVVVIGGGNVAMDVARSALRLGAKKVYAVCLESREEMPAWESEIEEALEEKVEIINSRGPKAIIEKDGKVIGIEFKKCTSVFDENKRFNPKYDEKNVLIIPADTIIITIGQGGDDTVAKGSKLNTIAPGRFEFDPTTYSLSQKGVFGAGEIVFGPGGAVDSIRKGHIAATAIDHYLRAGKLMKIDDSKPPHIGEIPGDVAEKIRERKRVEVGLMDPEKRVKDFCEIERCFTEEEALQEARRCVSCTAGAKVDETTCASCLNCVRICPYGVATIEKTASMPEEKCQVCGICASMCPAAAISLKRFETKKMRGEIEDFLKKAEKKKVSGKLMVAFACLYETTTRETLVEEKKKLLKENIYLSLIPCVGRLSLPDILQPLALGADSVVIIACEEEHCLYPEAELLLKKRVKRAKAMLESVRISPEKIDFYHTKDTAESSWKEFLEASRNKEIKQTGAEK